MSGTCQGTINITIPCTPNWTGGAWSACASNGTQTRTESDGCGNTRIATQVCEYIPPYTEAVVAGSCTITPSNVNPGGIFSVTMPIQPGTNIENYKMVLGGNLTGESSSFTIFGSSGITNIVTQTSTFAMPSNASGGAKSFTISLVKV